MDKILLLLLLIPLLTLKIYAEENQRDFKNSLFHIERSKNKNQVHYSVKLKNDCSFDGEEPVYGFWYDLEEGPNVTSDFSAFDGIAYGIVEQKIDEKNKNEITFDLKAIEERKIKVDIKKNKDGKCQTTSLMEINGKWSRIEKIYVFAVEGLIKPTVKYIDLFGKDENNKEVKERINID